MNDFKQALDNINQSIKHNPNSIDSIYIKGRSLMAMGAFDESFECFRNSVIKKSNDPAYWNAIAIYYFVKENYKDSFEKIIMASTLKP